MSLFSVGNSAPTDGKLKFAGRLSQACCVRILDAAALVLLCKLSEFYHTAHASERCVEAFERMTNAGAGGFSILAVWLAALVQGRACGG